MLRGKREIANPLGWEEPADLAIASAPVLRWHSLGAVVLLPKFRVPAAHVAPPISDILPLVELLHEALIAKLLVDHLVSLQLFLCHLRRPFLRLLQPQFPQRS